MGLRARFKINTVAIGIACVFVLLALGFSGLALFYFLASYLSPDTAALLTAALYLLLAIIILIFARLFSIYDRRHSRLSYNNAKSNPLEEALQQSFDPAIRDWVKQHPGRGVTLTLLVGVVLGSSDDARELLKQYVDRHFNDN